MVERPVFVPTALGACIVQEVPVTFAWNKGMAPSQKKKNIAALHSAADKMGYHQLLEVSSKSEHELGRRLSAFSLRVEIEGKETSVESAFQGSKVFERGGPFDDLYWVTSKDAKRDPRLKNSGHLTKFRFVGRDYPLSPGTAFYDWLYLNALYPHREWLKRLQDCAGFTDIEYNPAKSVNCQARSCATFVALQRRGLLDSAVNSFDSFSALLQRSNF